MIPFLKIEISEKSFVTLVALVTGLARIVKNEQTTWIELANSLLLITRLEITIVTTAKNILILIIAQVLINAQDVNIKMGEDFMVEFDLMELYIQQNANLSVFLIIETA